MEASKPTRRTKQKTKDDRPMQAQKPNLEDSK